MGGHAFSNLEIVRIKRENIIPTLNRVANSLKIKELSYEYMINNLAGSAGKQPDSGDLDILIDTSLIYLREVIYNMNVCFCTELKNNDNTLNMAWPIVNQNGYVQIDLMFGEVKWMKFTHWSPGLDNSKFKGVFIIHFLGNLAKYKYEYQLFDKDIEIARVHWVLDYNNGLTRYWRLLKKSDNKLHALDPDEWETKLPLEFGKLPPRFSRISKITDPDLVVKILLGHEYCVDDVKTFENLWKIVNKLNSDGKLYPPLEFIYDKWLNSLMKSDVKYTHTREQIHQMVQEIL